MSQKCSMKKYQAGNYQNPMVPHLFIFHFLSPKATFQLVSAHFFLFLIENGNKTFALYKHLKMTNSKRTNKKKKEMLYRLVKKGFILPQCCYSHCAVNYSSKQASKAHALHLYTHTELAEECITAAIDKKAKHKYFSLEIEVLLGFTTFETC